MDKFLSRVLPPIVSAPFGSLHPVYYVVGIKDGVPKHKPFINISDGVALARALSDNGYNTYFAPAVYKDYTFGRKAVNVSQLKALWLDIDVGKLKNSYPDRDTALQALMGFIQNTQLPPSIIVSTGAGFAIYWVFSRPIEAGPWKQLAHLFAALCRQQGLIVDPACTEDAARVMRMPGTVHQATGNTAQVLIDKGREWDPKEFIAVMRQSLRDEPGLFTPQAPIAPQAPSVMQQIAQQTGVGPQPPKAMAEPIVMGCNQMLTAGLGSEPQWYAAMSVFRRCKDGLEWAHKISATDEARYNEAQTTEKFYHAPEDNPARCDRFAAIMPELCAQCPHRGLISSPVQLYGRASAAQPVVIPQAEPVVIPQPEPVIPQEPVIQPAPPVDPVIPIDAVASPNVETTVTMQEVPIHVPPLQIPERFDFPPLKLVDPSFDVDQRGILHTYTDTDEMGNPVKKQQLLCPTQLYYTHTVYSRDADGAPRRVHWFVSIQPNGKQERLPFAVQTDMNPQAITRWFYQANMFPAHMGIKPGLLVYFMQAYIRSVQGANMELRTLDKFGWVSDFVDPVHNCVVPAFAIGRGVITESGLHPVSYEGVTERLAEQEFGVKGTLENWKVIPEMYKTLDQKAAQFAICMAFAAPLMKYCSGTATSAIFSLWSSASGLGKSQVLRACASIWGHPDKQFIQRNSSSVYRQRKLGKLHNLPCFMDELTDVKDEDLYSLAYTLVDGREKQKLQSSGDDVVKTGDWNTVTFTTANKSFKEAAAKYAGDSEASLIRVMEIECDFQSYADNPPVQTYINYCIDACHENYGLAGPEFIHQLMHRSDRLRTITKHIEHWAMMNEYASAERFLSNPVALALLCGRWAVEFGLLDYDMDALEDWVLRVFTSHNRQSTAHLRPPAEALLKTYVLDRQLNILAVESHTRPESMKEGPAGEVDLDPFIKAFPKREVFIRKEMDTGTLYISRTDLEKWCRQRGMSLLVFTTKLRNQGTNLKDTQFNLASGISWAILPVTDCIMVKPKKGHDMFKEFGV